MTQNRNFYVYVLFRPWDGSPCYVGKGKGNRWRNFSFGARTNRWLRNIIAKAERLGMDIPSVKVRENLIETEAFATERAFIAAIGRGKYGPLVNLTDGGDGPAGFKHKPETVVRHTKFLREMWADPDMRAFILEKQRIGKSTPEFHENRSAASALTWSSEERRQQSSKTKTDYYADPTNRSKTSTATKEAMARPDVKANTSAGQKSRFERPEEREKSAIRSSGRKQSATTIAKKVAKLTGQKRSAEARANMSAAQYLRNQKNPPSLETRAKMSASANARWATNHSEQGI